MRVTEFIKNHEDWERLLAAPPYCLKIKRDDGYIMLSYNQITSDFRNETVRECRGLILEDGTLRPVCVPFYKFGNYGESYVPEIDWASARTQEKIDGSLIKLWHDRGEWRVSTSGNIYARNAELTRTDLFDADCLYGTYYDLFEAARKAAGLDYAALDTRNTYMFELVSPYNKVVILYPELGIYHIGTRSNVTLEELDVDIGVRKPREYALGSLDGCIAAARDLPDDKEGYVVVDKFYNRIKIKNPEYVALNKLKNGGEIGLATFVSLIRENETAEFLTYFPEFASKIEGCKAKLEGIIAELERSTAELCRRTFDTRKEFALAVQDKPHRAFYFEWLANRELTPREWLWSNSDDKLVRMLGQAAR